MKKNETKTTEAVAPKTKRGETKEQAKTRRAARARKKEVRLKNESKPKVYSVMAGYDPNLKTEVDANLRNAGFKDFYSNDTYLYIKCVSQNDVEKLREILRNIKYEFKKNKKNLKGEIIQVVTRTLSVHYMNAFNGDKMATLIGVTKHRTRKSSTNTVEKRIAAHNARKEANKATHVKFVKKTQNGTGRLSILNRGKHSRNSVKKVSIAPTETEVKAAA